MNASPGGIRGLSFLCRPVLCGLLIGACSSGSNRDCEEAAVITGAAADEYCTEKDDECCFCKCWNQDRSTYDSGKYQAEGVCDCGESMDGAESCSGGDLEKAKQCLEDEETCRQNAEIEAEAECEASDIRILVCEEAAEVENGAWDEYCNGRSDECCLCKCFNDGHMTTGEYDPTTTPFTCTCVETDLECDYNAFSDAQWCLEDEEGCRRVATRNVEGECEATDLVENVCAKFIELQRQAWTSYCRGRQDECCFCRCCDQDCKDFDLHEYLHNGICECFDFEVPECTGEDLRIAQACLRDQNTCKAQREGLAMEICRYSGF